MKDNSITSHSMTKSAITGIGLAFDNYNRFMDTRSWKDNLQDTIGTGYELVENIQNQDMIAEDNIDLHTQTTQNVDTTDTAGASNPISTNNNPLVNEDTLNRTTSCGDNDMTGVDIGKNIPVATKRKLQEDIWACWLRWLKLQGKIKVKELKQSFS